MGGEATCGDEFGGREEEVCEGTLGILRMLNLDVYTEGILAYAHSLRFGNHQILSLLSAVLWWRVNLWKQTRLHRSASSESPSGSPQPFSPRNSRNRRGEGSVHFGLECLHGLVWSLICPV